MRWGGSAGGFTISWAFSPRDYADGYAPPYPPGDRIACNSLELRALCHQFNGRSSNPADKMGGLGGEASVGVWPKASRRSASAAHHRKQNSSRSALVRARSERSNHRVRIQSPLRAIQRTCPQFSCAQFNGPATKFHCLQFNGLVRDTLAPNSTDPPAITMADAILAPHTPITT